MRLIAMTKGREKMMQNTWWRQMVQEVLFYAPWMNVTDLRQSELMFDMHICLAPLRFFRPGFSGIFV